MEEKKTSRKTNLLFLIEVCEHGKTSFAPELGAANNDGLAGRDGNVQVSGVGLTHLNNTANTDYRHNEKHTAEKDKVSVCLGWATAKCRKFYADRGGEAPPSGQTCLTFFLSSG